MFGSTFGENIRVTTFGESHGKAIGAVIENFPAGVEIDEIYIQDELDRRKPSTSVASTMRKESDRIEILSGVFEGKTLGTPIAFIIRNEDQKSDDYDNLKNVFRTGHADFSYYKKYGIYDHRGGGRASARETAARVAAAAFAKNLLKKDNISIKAEILQIGSETNPENFDTIITKVKAEGDSIGGIVQCVVSGLPAGLGEPVFAKLQAVLAMAMMSIPAAKGFEYGEGFHSAEMRGSEHNDSLTSNRTGGILGGISTGKEIVFRVAFKPVSSIANTQQTFDKSGNPLTLQVKGRHDVCCVPRAVPVVEAMAALVLVDLISTKSPERDLK